MSEQDILGYPGRYILDSITLTGFTGNEINITEIVSTFTYGEDIFSPCVYGSCVIYDTLDLQQYLPICGEETIRVVYRSSDQDPEIDKTFRVYKVGNKQPISNTQEGYVLYFCSEEMVTDRSKKVSKSYKGFKTGEIVSDVVTSYLETDKSLEVDDTLEALHLIIPNLTPFESIHFCSSLSRSGVSSGSLYVFYEDRTGFKFKNLETLMTQEPIINDPVPVILQNVDSGSEQELFPSTALAAYSVEKASKDIISASIDGTFGNTVLSYDPLTRQFGRTEYDYNTNFSDTLHLDRSRLTSDQYVNFSPEQRISVVPTQSHRRDSAYYNSNSGDVLFPVQEEIVSKRTAQLGQLETIVVKGSLYGLTRLTAGVTLLIDMPNHTALENKRSDPIHKYLSGKYLVAKCNHVLTPGTYMTEVTLMKDTINSDLEFDLD